MANSDASPPEDSAGDPPRENDAAAGPPGGGQRPDSSPGSRPDSSPDRGERAPDERAPGAPLRPLDPERIGGYRLLGYLGEGGMGIVYSARDATGRLVAIKVVRDEIASDRQFRARFRRESESVQRVPRFCTAEVLHSEPDAERPYLVTEYIDGPSLDEAVAGGRTMEPGELEQLGVNMAAALNAIHGAGVIHRDLKPGNVLLSRVGPRVIDFGISRALGAATTLTVTGQTIGTPSFMAPEQFESGDATPATDIFAWGVVMAFAATGRQPFGGDTPATVGYHVMHREPDLSGLVEPMRSIVAQALRKDPAERPSAQRLLELLGAAGVSGAASQAGQPGMARTAVMSTATRVMSTQGVPGPPGQGQARGRPPGRARRRWAWGLFAGVAAMVTALLLTLVLNPDLLDRYREPELAGHWRGSYGHTYVRVDQDVVRMIYPDHNGRIAGTLDGRLIRGQWAEGSSVPGGWVRFTVGRKNGRLTLTGEWGRGQVAPGEQGQRGWDLERVDGAIPPAIARQLANPALFPPPIEPTPEAS